MKKYLFLSLICLTFINLNAQKTAPKKPVETKTKSSKTTKSAAKPEVVVTQTANKWSVEASVGQTKGLRPYSVGYYSSNPDKLFGQVNINTYELAGRCMFNPKFGLKLGIAYDKLDNKNTSNYSKSFQMQQFRINFQGVVNARNLFDLEPVTHNWGLLLHAGINLSHRTSKTEDILISAATSAKTNTAAVYDSSHNYNVSEWDGGIVYGIAPEFKISNHLAMILDFSVISNYRQHLNWDGSYSDRSNNLSGEQISTTLGVSYSYGNNKIHGDYTIVPDVNAIEREKLNQKIGELEKDLKDTDKDGIRDSLDVEPNSIPGVVVDSKGKTIDIDKNTNVPVDIEKFVTKSIAESKEKDKPVPTPVSEKESTEKMINDGFYSVYFEFGKVKITSGSLQNVGFILAYLKNNPTEKIEISGFADSVGSPKYNIALAKRRSNKVKEVIINSGIDSNRLILSKGVQVVKGKSEAARALSRKVSFKVIK